MIDTLIFDIGNVLVDFRWKEYFESLGHDENMVKRMADASVLSPDWKEVDLGNLPYEEILKLFIENDPGIERELRESLTDLNEILGKRHHTIPWLKELKEKGYRLLFLSNFSEKVLQECEHAMDFLPLMEGGIFSFRVHLIKPDPAIYQLLIHNYDLIPSNCVFIDDSQDNIDAAAKLGIHGITYKDLEQARRALATLGIC